MAGKHGGARRGAGRKPGQATGTGKRSGKQLRTQLGTVVERALASHAKRAEYWERRRNYQLRLSKARRDQRELDKADRELRKLDENLPRLRRLLDSACPEQEPAVENPTVMRMPPQVRSHQEWLDTYRPLMDAPPAHEKLAHGLELAKALAPAPKVPRQPLDVPSTVGPFGFPMTGPAPAELDLAQFMAERARLGRRGLN